MKNSALLENLFYSIEEELYFLDLKFVPNHFLDLGMLSLKFDSNVNLSDILKDINETLETFYLTYSLNMLDNLSYSFKITFFENHLILFFQISDSEN